MALGWRGQYFRYKEFFLNIANVYRQRPNLRAFLEVVLSLSTITVFLLFALKPTVLTIISLVQEIREKENTIATLDQKIANLQTASSVFSQAQESLPDIERSVPSEAEIDVVAKQIQGLAAKDSVTLLGFSIGQIILLGKDDATKKSTEVKPLPGDAKSMPLSISVRGEYSNLLAFLTDLGNLRIANKVDILGVNSSATETGQTIVISISGRVPFLTEQK